MVLLLLNPIKDASSLLLWWLIIIAILMLLLLLLLRLFIPSGIVKLLLQVIQLLFSLIVIIDSRS